jgi:biotin carboxylase
VKKSIALVLGASHSETPIIKETWKKADHIIIAGLVLYPPNLDLCHEFIHVDYSSFEEISKIIRLHHVTHILPGCNDFSLLNAVMLARHHNLNPHLFDIPDVAKKLHHKHLFRNTGKSLGINVPNYKIVLRNNYASEFSTIDGPVLVKPVDRSGGAGITLVQNKSELSKALEQAFEVTRQEKVIIESYLKGTEHSGQCFIKNFKVVSTNFSDEYCSHKYNFQIQGAITPSLLTNESKNDVVNQIEEIASSLKLVDGFIQFQFLQTTEKDLFIIEMCRRLPGDLLGEIYLHDSKQNIYNLFVDYMLNKPLTFKDEITSCLGRTYRHILEGPENSLVQTKSTHPDIELLSFTDLRMPSKNYTTKYQRIGIVFFRSTGNVTLSSCQINKLFLSSPTL